MGFFGKEAIRLRREKRKKRRQEFYECIREVAGHPVVRSMRKYPMHGTTSCYKHCLRVAYYNYLWCRSLGLDARSAARAGMLHDLFLYDWHKHGEETGTRFHGLTHPGEALKNAEKLFKLNDTERDAIRSHMWPVTLFTIPRTGEAWITTLTDKYCGGVETLRRKRASVGKGYKELSPAVESFTVMTDMK